MDRQYQEFTLSGTARPGSCLEIKEKTGTDELSILARIETDVNGKWSFLIKVHGGKNDILVESSIRGSKAAVVNIEGYTIKLGWPIGKKTANTYVPDYKVAHMEAWYGPNDYHRTFTGSLRSHNGLDIAGPAGTPILPVALGTVIRADEKWRGGNIVVVDHGSWGSMYLHLRSLSVKEGQTVTTGTKIGEMGKTGMADGVHLHLTVFLWPKNGKGIDYWKSQSTADLANLKLGLIRVNINPVKHQQLGPSILNSRKSENSDSLKCMNDVNRWEVDWSIIPVNWSPGAVYFDHMKPNESCNR
jgi:murein DD-endopeptidase MepM/ murein hydrolase activator NlpD